MPRPKRKKYPRLPNGYGSIKYLGRNRRNPYAVHPPATEQDDEGNYITPKALCYVSDWYTAFAVLTSYKAGTYVPGSERKIEVENANGISSIIQQMLADYSQACRAEKVTNQGKQTFSEVYVDYFKDKYENPHKRLSEASRNSTKAAYRNCSALHDRYFADLTYADLQNVVDECPLKHASLELIVSLFRQMWNYAQKVQIIAADQDVSRFVKINREDDDENGIPFSLSDLDILWKHKDDDIVSFILIMCYSGYRIKAYETIQVNLENRSFTGGVKTKAGKNRTVPIHSAILPLVRHRIMQEGKVLSVTATTFRLKMYEKLSELGIERHTPHDCRHTFSMLCEKYGVNENDRKRMLGHSFSDITNSTYGHRELEDLRREIEKIKVI